MLNRLIPPETTMPDFTRCFLAVFVALVTGAMVLLEREIPTIWQGIVVAVFASYFSLEAPSHLRRFLASRVKDEG